MGVTSGIFWVGVSHSKRVGVIDVTLLGLFREGDLEVFNAKGNGVFTLVADAFVIRFLHEGFEGFDALVTPGIELLGDADRVVEHHGKTLRMRGCCSKSR